MLIAIGIYKCVKPKRGRTAALGGGGGIYGQQQQQQQQPMGVMPAAFAQQPLAYGGGIPTAVAVPQPQHSAFPPAAAAAQAEKPRNPL